MHILLRFARKFVTPILPSGLRLPLRYWIHMQGEEPEEELRFLPSLFPQGAATATAIDVGANMGFFSYVLSKHFKRVVAFEANDMLTDNLSAHNSGNITVYHQALSSAEGDATLYIPVRDSMPLVGWASLKPGNCPGVDEHIQRPIKIVTLDSLAVADVGFMKIDVEGHEVEVLEGAYDTISRYRPTILIEVKDDNLNRVSEFFAKINYRMTKLEDWMDKISSPENYIFVPE
jgi:FkbM family methyltransferase